MTAIPNGVQNEFETVDEAYNEVLRLRSKMQEILDHPPYLEGGSCFYPMHDGEGNYIGDQNVDPLGVIQAMVDTAQEALSPGAEVRCGDSAVARKHADAVSEDE